MAASHEAGANFQTFNKGESQRTGGGENTDRAQAIAEAAAARHGVQASPKPESQPAGNSPNAFDVDRKPVDHLAQSQDQFAPPQNLPPSTQQTSLVNGGANAPQFAAMPSESNYTATEVN